MENYLFLLFSLTIIQAEWTQVDIPDNQNIVKLIADGNGLHGATQKLIFNGIT